MRRAAKIDRNHNEIADAFRQLGWTVKPVHQLKNFVDILISKNGRTVCVEIKDGELIPSKRKLTDGEKEFKESWQGEWALVESVEDAIKLDKAAWALC